MSPTPGWYPDPQSPSSLRWFDGESWTDGRAPARPGLPLGPRKNSHVALIVICCVLGSLLVLGVLAAMAIPVFLNQRAKATDAGTSSVTCAQVVDRAVTLSKQTVTGGQVALVGVADPVVVRDARPVRTVPPAGEQTFVMSCRGMATWADGQEYEVTIDVNLTSDRTQVLSLEQ